MNEDDNQQSIAKACGCFIFIFAVFLAVVLWQITPELIDFLEAWLKENS
jgi:hypothetical protein